MAATSSQTPEELRQVAGECSGGGGASAFSPFPQVWKVWDVWAIAPQMAFRLLEMKSWLDKTIP